MLIKVTRSIFKCAGQGMGSTAITPIVGITPYQNKWTIKVRH
jgi:hypothetical protein